MTRYTAISEFYLGGYRLNNYAFIDSQNLNLSITNLGWKLDFRRFRVYLKDRYKVTKAFLFIGYIKANEGMYKSLRSAGYRIIFKPTLSQKNNKHKGNCDAELVLHAMIEINNYDQAVVVSGDGDFFCLVAYLLKKKKLAALGIPNKKQYSALLKDKVLSDKKFFIDKIKKKVELKKREA